MKKILSFLFAFLVLALSLRGEETPHVATLSLFFPMEEVSPGSTVEGVIEYSIEEDFHLYWKNPGDAGSPPSFIWTLPDGVSVKSLVWPTPSRFQMDKMTFFGYTQKPKWLVKLFFGPNMKEGPAEIRLSSQFIGCKNICIPGSQEASFTFTVSKKTHILEEKHSKILEAEESLPEPLSEASATLLEKSLQLELSLPNAFSDIQGVVVFPELQEVFEIETLPTWKQDGKKLTVTVPLHESEKVLLDNQKEFLGLVQIKSSTASKTYAISTPFHVALPSNVLVNPQSISLWNNSFLWFVLTAFFGGLLLNITPCVLPVIGLKALFLATSKTMSKKRVFLHGLSFTLGVLLAFWALAGLLYFFQHIGSLSGWGFQLQEPLFVAFLLLLVFIFAFNLFGIFEFGTSISSWAMRKEEESSSLVQQPIAEKSLFSSLFYGLFATCIATPCTGPLLGSVLGFLITLHPGEGFVLFTAIGLGMAMPLFLLSIFPPLLKLIPKPGPWLITVKQFLGFFLLGTALWLFWVLSYETSSLSLPMALSGLFLVSFGLWIYGHWGMYSHFSIIQNSARVLSFLITLVGASLFFFSFPSKLDPLFQRLPALKMITWEEYSEEKLEQGLEEGRIVFIDFEAKWCLTCQANKITFLSQKVVNGFSSKNVLALRADWTNGDPKITRALQRLKRNGVPVYVFFKKGRNPHILSELPTVQEITEALDALATDKPKEKS